MTKIVSISIVISLSLCFVLSGATRAWSMAGAAAGIELDHGGTVNSAIELDHGGTVNSAIDSAKKIIDNAKKQISRSVDKAGELKQKLADEWDEFKVEKVNPIGEYIASAYRWVKKGNKGHPPGFESRPVKKIDSPDISINLSSSAARKIINKMSGVKIPFDKDNPESRDYFCFDEASLESDITRNIFILHVKKGRLKFDFVAAGNALKINSAKFELAPIIRNENDKIMLDIHARAISLDIDNAFTWLDRTIEHGLNDYMVDKNSQNGFISFDLTEALKTSFAIADESEKINIALGEASIQATANGLALEFLILSDK